MARMVWDAVGARRFETGIDRAVLYAPNVDGVPWNGLLSVKEAPANANISSYYIDGQKYVNVMEGEDYGATLEAYTYPQEFEVCQGTALIRPGFYATAQDHTMFNLSYRTLIGDDLVGQDKGYKIHLVYNATATAADKEYNTIGAEVEPSTFEWGITAVPVTLAGAKPTAHVILDSTQMDYLLITAIENILYGTGVTAPRMISMLELNALITNWHLITITDNHDGTFTASTAEGHDDLIVSLGSGLYSIDGATIQVLDPDTFNISDS